MLEEQCIDLANLSVQTISSDRLVQVFNCGVQKGGTSSLFAHFLDHPQLHAPRRKEIHFFDDETQNWPRPRYADLHDWFDEPACNRLRFDTTPIYCFWQPSVSRLKSYNPKAKIICVFRDPIERAWSHWKMEFSRDAETLKFAEAIREGRNRLDRLQLLKECNRVYSYVERGFYGSQVQSLQQEFPREQLLFLRSQDLKHSHTTTLKQISEFLGIETFPDTGPKREHEAAQISYPSVLTVEDQLYLCRIFAPELEKFKRLTNIDTSEWLTERLMREQSSGLANQASGALCVAGGSPR